MLWPSCPLIAGGIATFAHVDYVHEQLRASANALAIPTPRVVGFPISGYYMDVPYFTDQKAFAFEQQNMTRVGGSVDSLAGRRMVILCSGVLG